MSNPLDLLHRHLNGETLSEAERAALSDWVCASPDHAKLVAELTCLDQTLAANLRGAANTPLIGLDESDPIEGPPHEQQQPAGAADELPPIHIPSAEPLTKKKVAGALAYVIEHSITPKRIAIIAAVLLGTVLAIVFLTGPEPNQQIAAIPDPIVVQNPVVATLTAQHNAQWADRALAHGSYLHAGQRLTLTAGFAEITTARGAVAILESPATIEFIDSPNAIRLHAGKLVGICETESSKGLLVRTPHMDVIDLGTRFGVAIGEQDSRVQVIEGEVEVAAALNISEDPPTRLIAGQAAVVDTSDDASVRIQAASDAFVYQWQAVANAPALTGEIRYVPAIPTALSLSASEGDEIQLYPERAGINLQADTLVTFSEPGERRAFTNVQSTLPAGTTVDSYFISLYPVGEPEQTLSCHATITFDRPILGLIATGEHLNQTHSVFGLPGVDYAIKSAENGKIISGLEISISGPDMSDRISLSDDRKTLRVELHAGEALDQMRVLVASKQPGTGDTDF